MKSFQSALHALSFDPLLARLFATRPWTDAAGLIDWVAESDPYGETRHIRRALDLASASGSPRGFVEHQVWCAWRQAAWTSGLAQPLEMSVEGEEWLRETEGFPTLLVTPMTLATADAMSAIGRLNRSDRPCIVFGEDMDMSNALPDGGLEILSGASVSGMARATVRRILEVLDHGGVLCTYPDFVYEGRSAEIIPLFGIRRPVSSGFLSMAARNGTMLLPLVCLRQGDALVIHIEEPLQVRDERTQRGADDGTGRARVATAVGDLLESLIRRAPEQWLLLPTLTFESPEMAAVTT